MPSDQEIPKHRQIYDALHQAIISGHFSQGARLPSETELVEQYQASRPTVARALRDLQERGFVQRRVGSGTFVRLQEPQQVAPVMLRPDSVQQSLIVVVS